MKLILITFLLLGITICDKILAQDDCPSLTVILGKKIIEQYENTANRDDIIIIKLENTINRFRLSKVKLKIFPKGSYEIITKGLTTKFSSSPTLEIPIERILSENESIEKIMISVLEIIDESTNSPSECFYYGQEYTFWLNE